MAVTSVTIALALAEQMADTKQKNTGMLQADSAPGETFIPASMVVAIWMELMPEAVLFPTMAAWDKDTTPGNQTNMVDVSAIGCSLAYISDYCAHGGSLDIVAAKVRANPYLELDTLPNAPDWATFIQHMRIVRWCQSNDPCGAWLP